MTSIFSDAHLPIGKAGAETKLAYRFFIFSYLAKVGIFRKFSKIFENFRNFSFRGFPGFGRILVGGDVRHHFLEALGKSGQIAHHLGPFE